MSGRLGARRTLLVSDTVRGPLVAAVPVLPWTDSLSFPLCSPELPNGVVNPSLHALLTMRPPPGLRTQALSAELTVVAVAGPAGFLLAGPALDRFGVDSVFLAVAAAQSLAMGVGSVLTLRSSLEPKQLRAAAPVQVDELEPVDVVGTRHG